MFTGLVADVGIVRSVARTGAGARLEVESQLAAELGRGDSVAVSGVCLTAVEAAPGWFGVDVVPETLARSTLGGLADRDRVNLELPVQAADRLGGHIVQGHVDGVGVIEGVAEEGLSRRVAVRAGPDLCRYVVDKGSVALDGVSLTAVDTTAEGFAVTLIPETLERTTLGDLGARDSVNVEVDLLAKYVERLMPGVAEAAVEAGAGR